MFQRQFNRRPFESAMLEALENGTFKADLTEDTERLARRRLRLLRNQRDMFVYECVREESANNDLAVESFRAMARDCNRKMKNIRSVLYPTPSCLAE